MAARAVFSRLYRALPAAPCLLAIGHCSLACHVSAEGGAEVGCGAPDLRALHLRTTTPAATLRRTAARRGRTR